MIKYFYNSEYEIKQKTPWQIIQSIKKGETRLTDWKPLLDEEEYQELSDCFDMDMEKLKQNFWH